MTVTHIITSSWHICYIPFSTHNVNQNYHTSNTAELSIPFHKAAYSKMFQTTTIRVSRKHVHVAWLARVVLTLTKIWPGVSKIGNIHGLQIYNNNLMKVLYLYKHHYYSIMYNKSCFTAKTLTANSTNTSVFKNKP